MEDKNLQEAFRAWEEMSQTKETNIAYQSRLKYILDEEAKLEDVKYHAKREGIEEGVEQGLEQGTRMANEKTALNLLEMKMDVKMIAEVTGLSIEQVEALKAEG